jgi:hypothetical protein
MSMIPFQLHVRRCEVCRRWSRVPCARGYELFERAAVLLTWAAPIRAKA